EKNLYAPYFADHVLECARIVDGSVPFWLRRDMEAVVLGNRIYFRENAYQSRTARGVELLGHELTHVEQFNAGMTIWHYLWASRWGYGNNHYEIEACARAAEIRRSCSGL
ncbi:MAG TPA: DUF4157 domain-containing protein, partial [Methylophilaceae bacterium]|nr:DUF4157 domain-containing protein [Methylophilaceae bacterium]